jgi:hypothetical protein
MGGAMTALRGDQTAVYTNPSSVALLKRKDFVLTHHSTIAGIRQIQSGWAYGTGRVGLGLSVAIHTADGFEARTGPTLNPIGTFNLFEFNAAFTYGQRIAGDLYGGFTTRFLHEDVEADRASGFGLDLGLTYRPSESPFAIGASVLNLGKMDRLDLVASSLPREIRFGVTLDQTRYQASADYRLARFGSNGIHVGGEVVPVEILTIRLGYQSGHDTRSMSYGLGLRRKNWRLDYAFVPSSHGFEDAHRITLGIR